MNDEYEDLISQWSRAAAAIPFPSTAIGAVLRSSYPARSPLTQGENFRLVEAGERVQRAAECFIEFYASPARMSLAKQTVRAVYIEQRLTEIETAAANLATALDSLLADSRQARARGHLEQAQQLENFARLLDHTLQGDLQPEPAPIVKINDRPRTIANIWAQALSTFNHAFASDPEVENHLLERLRIRHDHLLTPGRLRSVVSTARDKLSDTALLQEAKVGGGQRPTNVAVAGLIKQLANTYVTLWQTPASAKTHDTKAGLQESRYLAFVTTCFAEMIRVSGGLVTTGDTPSETNIKSWSAV